MVGMLVVAGSAPGATLDPMGLGPYAVGSTRRTFVKPSVTTGEPRVLETLVWYPALTGSSPGGSFVGEVPRGRWPLVIFSHGSCSLPDQSSFLMTALASRGMIVAAPPHPGNTIFDGLTQCGVNHVDSYQNRVADVVFVLDQLQLESTTPGSLLYRHIHPRRVGIMGHSFGAQTVLRALAADRRFRAGIALAPKPAIDLVVTRPLLVMTGTLDSITPFESAARGSFALARGIRYLVRLPDTGHCAFVPLCLPGLCGVGCPPDGLEPETANERVQRVVVPFAFRYVAGKGRYRQLLDPTTMPPGIEVLEAISRPH
jgi:predicted dienelactone hydrolase